jgi:hypothetical protein
LCVLLEYCAGTAAFEDMIGDVVWVPPSRNAGSLWPAIVRDVRFTRSDIRRKAEAVAQSHCLVLYYDTKLAEFDLIPYG